MKAERTFRELVAAELPVTPQMVRYLRMAMDPEQAEKLLADLKLEHLAEKKRWAQDGFKRYFCTFSQTVLAKSGVGSEIVDERRPVRGWAFRILHLIGSASNQWAANLRSFRTARGLRTPSSTPYFGGKWSRDCETNMIRVLRHMLSLQVSITAMSFFAIVTLAEKMGSDRSWEAKRHGFSSIFGGKKWAKKDADHVSCHIMHQWVLPLLFRTSNSLDEIWWARQQRWDEQRLLLWGLGFLVLKNSHVQVALLVGWHFKSDQKSRWFNRFFPEFLAPGYRYYYYPAYLYARELRSSFVTAVSAAVALSNPRPGRAENIGSPGQQASSHGKDG